MSKKTLFLPKLWLVTKDVSKINVDKLRLETIGVYFARYDKRGDLRLSIEGTMMVGSKAKKNVVEINDKELYEWVRGIDLDKIIDDFGYVILKHGKNFVGCGKAFSNGILNHVPKNRRIKKL